VTTGFANADCAAGSATAGGTCTYWSQIIQPYTKSADVFKCPSNTANQYFYGGAATNAATEAGPSNTLSAQTFIPLSYGINPRFTDAFLAAGTLDKSSGSSSSPKALASINAPASTIIVGERASNPAGTTAAGNDQYDVQGWVGEPGLSLVTTTATDSSATQMFYKHSGQANHLFADGHVKSLKASSTIGGLVSQWGWFKESGTTNCSAGDPNCTYIPTGTQPIVTNLGNIDKTN